MHRPVNNNGFTLLEILLVVAAIGILAGIVILAINPGRQLAAARNAQRQVDVNTILNAIYQFSLDHNGRIPETINTFSANDTCLDAANSENPFPYSICVTSNGCSGINMDDLITNSKYLVGIPRDPSGYTPSNGDENQSGYFVIKQSTGRVSVCAPLAENDQEISVSR
jgi:prepilin-type N-terminal cleavage/methylation domain-containing protein